MTDPHQFLDAAKVARISQLLETLDYDELMGVFAITLALRARQRTAQDEVFDLDDDFDDEIDIPSGLQWPAPSDDADN